MLTVLVLVTGPGLESVAQSAEQGFVALPRIVNATVAPRVVYIENPRLAKLTTSDLRQTLRVAATLVEDHFGIKALLPDQIPVLDIDTLFAGLVANKQPVSMR